MQIVASRRKTQPAPPHVLFRSLTEPCLEGTRHWLELSGDEREPRVLASEAPSRVVWSSIWPDRPEDQIIFVIAPDGSGGSSLEWALESEESIEPAQRWLLKHRLDELINRDLRLSFGN